MNAINVISPYKYYRMWVFDDPRVGLVQEPFVAAADIMMECLVADIPDAAKGFILIFAGAPFPDYQHRHCVSCALKLHAFRGAAK